MLHAHPGTAQMGRTRSSFLSSLLAAHKDSIASRRADKSKPSKIELTIVEGLIERVLDVAEGRRDAPDSREEVLRDIAGVVKGYLARLVSANQTWRILSRTDPRQVSYRDLFEGTRRAVLRVMVVYEDMRRRLRGVGRRRKTRVEGRCEDM